MISGFSKKKIKSEKTLGELFKSTRQKKEISLEDAEVATRVKLKYLKALEENNWSILPLEVYVRGFVLSYSKFLGIKKDEALFQFEIETALHAKKQSSELSYKKSFRDIRFLITPKLLAYSALTLFVTAMVGYIVFQITNFAGLPSLEIITPNNNAVIEQESIDMAGLTDPNAVVTVNDEKVPVTQEGRFISSLRLHRGVNVIKVKAINKTQKENTRVYTLEYKPKTALIDNITNQ